MAKPQLSLPMQMAAYLRISMNAYWEDHTPTEFMAMMERSKMHAMIEEEMYSMQDSPDHYLMIYGWEVLSWDMLDHFNIAYAEFIAN